MTNPDDSAVRVTLRDVFQAVNELKTAVNEVQSDVRRLADRDDRAEQLAADHEQRLRALERRVWALPTLSAIVGVIAVALSVLQWVTK